VGREHRATLAQFDGMVDGESLKPSDGQVD
jgi:hypothetical protein